jgi:hypothetical protein
MVGTNPHPHHPCRHGDRTRLGQWCVLTALTIVALAAIRQSHLNENATPMTSETHVMELAIGAVLVMGAFCAIAHVALTDMFVSSIAEGVLVRFLL